MHEVAEAGIARTFQNIRLFAEMTRFENVMGRPPSAHLRRGDRRGLAHRRLQRRGGGDREARTNCSTTSAWRYADTKAARSYGDQRRLEIARALATDPKLSCSTNPPPA